MLDTATTASHKRLITWDEKSHPLGHESMDATHEEFVHLANALANSDKTTFMKLFIELQEHTQVHFSAEEVLMTQSGFPAIAEHISEHRRVLGEMAQLAKRVQKGSLNFARAYVQERLPEWFALHLITMDQALVVHLQKQP